LISAFTYAMADLWKESGVVPQKMDVSLGWKPTALQVSVLTEHTKRSVTASEGKEHAALVCN
jgi:hypothetical protein